MAMNDQEFQEQLFNDVGEIKDVLNIHSKAFVALSSQVARVLEAVTKEVEDDSLYQVLRDIHTALGRNNDLLARIDARLGDRAREGGGAG
jgi:hypothetical protein